MIQLYWFLGTAASNLSERVRKDDALYPMMSFSMDGSKAGVSLDIFRLEGVLRDRLKALAARVQKRAKAEKWQEGVTLSLRYRTRFVEVLFPSKSRKRQRYMAAVEETYSTIGQRWVS